MVTFRVMVRPSCPAIQLTSRDRGCCDATVSSPELSESVWTWCVTELGSAPLEVLHVSEQMSSVLGLRLEDGREVAVKTRPDDVAGRASACVEVQRVAGRAGQPVAMPLTPVQRVRGLGGDALVRHAEEWRGGGEMMRDDRPEAARRSATGLAALMEVLTSCGPKPAIVGPPWVNWAHDGPGVFPPIPFLDQRDQDAVPTVLMGAARRVKELMAKTSLPHVVGHADFEAQNLRWQGDQLWCIHDFDSIGTAPEAAFVGAAAGAFSSQETPTLAPLGSSSAFIEAYQRARGRPFTALETQVAWAASLWPAVWNARGEALFGNPLITTEPLLAQLDERLQNAGLAAS